MSGGRAQYDDGGAPGGAAPKSFGARGPRKAAQATDRKVRLTGVSQAPRRLPRLHRLRALARGTSHLGRVQSRREIAAACEE